MEIRISITNFKYTKICTEHTLEPNNIDYEDISAADFIFKCIIKPRTTI